MKFTFSLDLRRTTLLKDCTGIEVIEQVDGSIRTAMIIMPAADGGFSRAGPIVSALNVHAAILEDLRSLAIKQHVRMAEGGGYINNGRSCAICRGEWKEGKPEHHAATCSLAIAERGE